MRGICRGNQRNFGVLKSSSPLYSSLPSFSFPPHSSTSLFSCACRRKALSDLRFYDADLGLLRYYARLASNIASDGKLKDFLMIAESVLTSDTVARENPLFIARVNTRMVGAGVCGVLREGELGEVLEFLNGAEKLEICPSSLFDEEAVALLAGECMRFV